MLVCSNELSFLSYAECVRESSAMAAYSFLMARFPVQMALFAPDGTILDSNNANTFMSVSEEDDADAMQGPDAS